jgi:hypothetical protein
LSGRWKGEDGAVLTLDAGGKATVTKFPIQIYNSLVPGPFTGEGTWSIKNGDGPEGPGIDLRIAGGGVHLTFRKHRSGQELAFIIGDPDEDKRYRFRKEDEPSGMREGV